MKKLYISRILKFTAVILTIAVLFLLAQEYLFFFTDYNQERFEKFYYEEPDSLDVVVMGASEIHTGYSPGHAYDQFGYTSYLYTQDSNHGQLYIPQLKEILAHQSPELIVVETFGFFYTGDVEEPRFRIFAENIPLSVNRIETILESPFEEKLSYLFPLIKYHGKWWSDDMLRENIKYKKIEQDKKAFFKGMMTHTITFDPATMEGAVLDPENRVLPEPRTIEVNTSLVEFLEFCREENVENLVFVNFPRHESIPDMEDMRNRVYTIENTISSYDYPFINFQEQTEEIGIDFATDYYDEHHMNVYGQFKMTEHLGNILVNEYGLTPRAQSVENTAHWQECVEQTEKYYDVCDYHIQKGEEITLSTETSFLEAIEKWEKMK